MLRPKRMSKVSVTASKRVMTEVVEAVHGLNLLDVTDYDGSWEGFERGDPAESAEPASEQLVTVRAIESILGVDEMDRSELAAERERVLSAEELAEGLESVRAEVNELDDRRDEITNELRAVEERIETAAPLASLGIDLDLLSGYRTIQVAVGEGDPDAVRGALGAADSIRGFEVFEGDGVLAAAARPAPDAGDGALTDALVGVGFASLEVPDASGDPAAHVAELEGRRETLQSRLDDVEDELAALREEWAGFLLAAEEQLSIDVQKREAPLSFATTANAFVAEGWIPSERYEEFAAELTAAVDDRVEVEELERVDFDSHGHAHAADVETGGDADGSGDSEVVADGGTSVRGDIVTMGGDPPTVQDNPGPVKPFEALVEVINRPKYGELDPTVVLFLTFPVFFGFMIGDLGYGLLYMGIGYWLVQSFESDVIKSLGGVGLWSGVFTALFGVLYGEFFGLHQLGEIVWNGHPPIHKGLQPHFVYYAYAWLLVSVVVGVFHLVVGRLFDLVNDLEHGFGEAFVESGSWIVLTLGLWWWVFSLTATGPKPNFMFSVFASEGATHPVTGEAIQNVALPLGFTGFRVVDLGPVSLQLLVALVGLALVLYAEGAIGLVESITQAFGHVVSYTRIAAVLLAKAGMALAVNLLVFGAYLKDGEFHFIFFEGAPESTELIVFGGLVTGSDPVSLVLGGLFGLVVLVVGHLLVLVLGITSAGLQAIRLEYVEFFGKFYEGGGDAYSPFGRERTYTAED